MDRNETEGEEGGTSRGSQHYLSMAIRNPKERLEKERRRREREKSKKMVVEKRDSHRVYKDQGKRQNEEVSCELGSELTPVKQVSNPAAAVNSTPIATPRVSGLGIIGTTEYTLSNTPRAIRRASLLARLSKWQIMETRRSNPMKRDGPMPR
jgi:hypothetical protein